MVLLLVCRIWMTLVRLLVEVVMLPVVIVSLLVRVAVVIVLLLVRVAVGMGRGQPMRLRRQGGWPCSWIWALDTCELGESGHVINSPPVHSA